MNSKVYSRHKLSKILLFIGFFVCCNALATARPELLFKFPTIGQNNISAQADLKLGLHYPYKFDSTNFRHRDTSIANYTPAIVSAFPSEFYVDSDSSLKTAILRGIFCNITLLNDTTVLLTPRSYLSHNTEYNIWIQNLKSINTVSNDTNRLDTMITHYFTTTAPMYRVTKYSHDNQLLKSHDTITVYFNRKLIINPTAIDSLICLRKIIGNQPIDSTNTYTQITTREPIVTTITNDSLGIMLYPDSLFHYQYNYLLDINLKYLTGNSQDNITFNLFTAKCSEIRIYSSSINPSDTLPIGCNPVCGNSCYFVKPNSTFILETPQNYQNFSFVEWRSENLPIVNQNKNTSISIPITEDNLDNYIIYAYYAKTPYDTVSLPSTSFVGGTVQMCSSTPRINDSTFVISRKAGEYIRFHAIPQTGYQFDHWESNDPNINGSTNTYLDIYQYNPSSETDNKNNQLLKIASVPCAPAPVSYWAKPILIPIKFITPCTQPTWNFDIVYDQGYGVYETPVPAGNKFNIKDIIQYAEVIDEYGNATNVSLSGSNLEVTGSYSPYTQSFPITRTMSVKLLPAYENMYEIAYYYSAAGVNVSLVGRKWNFNDSPTPYGIPVGTSFSEAVTLDSRNCYCNLNVVILKKRIPVQLELAADDNVSLPCTSPLIRMGFNIKGDYETERLGNDQQNPTIIGTNIGTKDEFISRYRKTILVPANTDVSITPTVNLDHGYSYKNWVAKTSDEPELLSEPASNYTLTINTSTTKGARFLYHSDFKIVEVGYVAPEIIDHYTDSIYTKKSISSPQDDKSGSNYFMYKVYSNGWPQDHSAAIAGMSIPTGRYSPYILGYEYKTTSIRAKFNQPVAQSICNGLVKVHEEEDHACDNTNTDSKDFFSSTDNSYLTDDNYTFMFTIKDSQTQMSHLAIGTFTFSNLIQNQSNTETLNQNIGILRTEAPGVVIRYHHIHATHAPGDHNTGDEIFINIVGAVSNHSAEKGQLAERDSLRIPQASGSVIHIAGGQADTAITTLMSVDKLTPTSYIGWGHQILETDGAGDASKKFQAIASSALTALTSIIPDEGNWKIAHQISEAASNFVKNDWDLLGWFKDEFIDGCDYGINLTKSFTTQFPQTSYFKFDDLGESKMTRSNLVGGFSRNFYIPIIVCDHNKNMQIYYEIYFY